MEEWKEIVLPKFEVSNLGRVRRVSNGYVLNLINSRGYDFLSVHIPVHRLVATAFIPNPENKPEVDHIKQVRLGFCDNSVTNLRWATPSENCCNRIRKPGDSGERNIRQLKSGTWEVRFRVLGNNVYKELFKTLEEAVDARNTYLLKLKTEPTV